MYVVQGDDTHIVWVHFKRTDTGNQVDSEFTETVKLFPIYITIIITTIIKKIQIEYIYF